jgi:LmbE family N-acetylglucosaminyl deacetylase
MATHYFPSTHPHSPSPASAVGVAAGRPATAGDRPAGGDLAGTATLDRPAGKALSGRCVVFLHAHPDDEAIFTGATMHRLAAEGARVVLVTATAGELGPALTPLAPRQTLAELRREELERAAQALGVARLVLLGRRDSGMPGWPANAHPNALARADMAETARGLARLCEAEGAEALVHYDQGGIYRHPDHLAVHRIGTTAAAHARITAYQATVDRDRIGKHLVGRAAAGLPEQDRPGRHRDEVTTVVTADRGGLAAKRAAMAAHASQIDAAALRPRGFAATYGTEWYVRTGAPGLVDEVGQPR